MKGVWYLLTRKLLYQWQTSSSYTGDLSQHILFSSNKLFIYKVISSAHGLKRGCFLSPPLFNLFINDLALELGWCGIGIRFGEDIVNWLLFADDLIRLAEREAYLQILLNLASDWSRDLAYHEIIGYWFRSLSWGAEFLT